MPLSELNRNPEMCRQLTDWIRTKTGIDWSPERYPTLPLRSKQAMTHLRIDSAQQLLHKLTDGLTFTEENTLIDIFTNHETRFFRDLPQFSTIKSTIIPELMRRKQATRQLNIWCAACSTGQEPVSLAMLLDSNFPELQDWNVSILGTDISPVVLERARAGIYSTLEVGRGLPVRMLVRYFEKSKNDWVLKKPLRERIQYRTHNLLKPMVTASPFDLILVRNVLIYFSPDDRKRALQNIARVLDQDGYLFLGTAESATGVDILRPIKLNGTLAFQRIR